MNQKVPPTPMNATVAEAVGGLLTDFRALLSKPNTMGLSLEHLRWVPVGAGCAEQGHVLWALGCPRRSVAHKDSPTFGSFVVRGGRNAKNSLVEFFLLCVLYGEVPTAPRTAHRFLWASPQY